MVVHYVERRPYRRICGVFPTLFLNLNGIFLIPFRITMWVVHFTALICVSRGSKRMIIESSLPDEYLHADYVFLCNATNLCLATSFLCLFFNMWGIVTGRTLRYGLDNFFQGACDGAAGVLLILAWRFTAHVARLWHVFYFFTIIPTGFELLVLLNSYIKGIDIYS
ncbi:unnamed protein product [Phytomonas sp. EM1]|nr:unnamed protein product [Phytomonas sp. EM1]|eukprot:CCW61677.1 unnamed protein product [Phytomonas sp. isolate EM1]